MPERTLANTHMRTIFPAVLRIGQRFSRAKSGSASGHGHAHGHHNRLCVSVEDANPGSGSGTLAPPLLAHIEQRCTSFPISAHNEVATDRRQTQSLDPSPFELLLAAYAASTAQTLRRVIGSKGWHVDSLHVHASIETVPLTESKGQPVTGLKFKAPIINQDIEVHGSLNHSQLIELSEHAKTCPIFATLKNATEVNLNLIDASHSRKAKKAAAHL